VSQFPKEKIHERVDFRQINRLRETNPSHMDWTVVAYSTSRLDDQNRASAAFVSTRPER
jgi:hypothetical protein